MMKHGLVLLLWLSTTFAYAQAAPSNHAADEQAISRLNEQLLKAYNLGDVNTLERIEDADFLVAGDFGEVSKSQQLDDVRHRKDNPTSVALTVSNPRFRFYADTALLTELDIQDGAANQLVQRLTSAGATAPVYYHCDLTDIAELQHTVKSILSRFHTVDVLVNNAGNDSRHKTAEVTATYWDQAIAVNLKHQFFMAQAVMPSMQKAQRGSIINMSSIGWAIPSTNQVVYVTSKAAIVGLSRTLSQELGVDNIRVNCIMPGAILTERQQRLWLTETYKAEILANQALKRMILPEEVARLVLFLASDDSSAITNQSYVIDAGWV